MTAARAPKYKPATNAAVVEVLSEKTTKKTIRKRGAPCTVTQLVVTYRLDCGHTIERTKPRTTDPATIGRRMVCEHCNAGVADAG